MSDLLDLGSDPKTGHQTGKVSQMFAVVNVTLPRLPSMFDLGGRAQKGGARGCFQGYFQVATASATTVAVSRPAQPSAGEVQEKIGIR
jgi:hypothetical protein